MSAAASGAAQQPITDFSDCHVGILGMLGELSALARAPAPTPQRSEAARRVLAFFRDVVSEHHKEEERDLFPAVQRDAREGEELARVRTLPGRLTIEHRRLEALYAQLADTLSDIERGHDLVLDAASSSALAAEYRAHADFEESVFLPLAQEILGRNSDHMAALGLALHIRHASREVRHKFGII